MSEQETPKTPSFFKRVFQSAQRGPLFPQEDRDRMKAVMNNLVLHIHPFQGRQTDPQIHLHLWPGRAADPAVYRLW